MWLFFVNQKYNREFCSVTGVSYKNGELEKKKKTINNENTVKEKTRYNNGTCPLSLCRPSSFLSVSAYVFVWKEIEIIVFKIFCKSKV